VQSTRSIGHTALVSIRLLSCSSASPVICFTTSILSATIRETKLLVRTSR
jgi:hypothetical protein